jgi:flagellar protein FliL
MGSLPRLLIAGMVGLALAGAEVSVAFAAEGAKAEKPKADAKKGEGGKDAKPLVQGVPGGPLFYDLPDILVNLETDGPKPVYLKVRVALQIARETDAPVIQAFMPRILDNLTLYLRELRPESLKNPKNLDRLRQELLLRIGQEVKPIKVGDILFREFLIQ